MLAFLFVLVALQTAPASAGQPQDDCSTWQDCRDKARAAAARDDFELFHHLAWRAVQKGPKNDGALMTMLARAQSLSGRPHDALVMLQRLAALGVATDAAESEDFRRVRALPGWSDLQARIAGVPPAVPAADRGATPAAAAPPADAAAKPAPPPPAAAVVKEAAADTAGGEATEALRFTTDPFVPAGLAYDAVSNRFIVADRRERKLSVVGERSQRMSNLIGAESGGFGDIGAMAIDRREGDLWVASTADGGGAKLHKLQLISGRVLWSAGLAAGVAPATYADLALTPSSDVLALDILGRRIFRLKHQGAANREAEMVLSLEPKTPTSIAPASDTVVYVAHREGISRADLSSHTVREMKAAAGIDLTGFAWIRWHRGHLLAVQRGTDDTYRIVRIRLNGGGTVTRLDVLERRASLASASSVALTADALFYLAVLPTSSDSAQFVVRRIPVN